MLIFLIFSDIHTLDSGWGPTTYPVVVGHEIVGTVTAVGPSVSQYKVGDRVGVGAQVWSCQKFDACSDCQLQQDALCPHRVFTYNSKYSDGQQSYGGYAEAVRVSEKYAFKIPENLPSDVCAPLLCAGVTVFNPLKQQGVKPGSKVGVVGIGGLGHLAIQFAAKMGAQVVAVSHSANKKAECQQLGSSGFVLISDKNSVKAAVQSLDVLLVTSNHTGQPWDVYLSLLKNRGVCVLLAVPEEPLEIGAGSLIMRELTLTGSLIGSRKVVQEMLEFAAKHEVRPWIEKVPMEEVNGAIQKVRDGKVRYRMVLEAKFD